MSRTVSATILLLFGTALVKLGLSNELLLYVRPVARPWVLLAGLAVVALAASSLASGLLARSRTRPDGDTSTSPQDHGHRHDGTTRTAWLVLAPVVAVLIVAPPALGTYSADRAPLLNAAASGAKARLTPGTDPVELPMLAFLVLAEAKPASLAGRPISLVGFVQRVTPGGFVLARLVITCCAADASTGAVSISGDPAPTPVGTWVRVTGTFSGPGTGTVTTPLLRATAVTPIARPVNPYG